MKVRGVTWIANDFCSDSHEKPLPNHLELFSSLYKVKEITAP